MSTPDEAPRLAVLRDYPLRIWARQQQYTQELLREFTLLVMGEHSGETSGAPAQLVQLAEMFTERYGTLIDAIAAERQAAFDRGQDRMDSQVPLVDGVPALLEQVDTVLRASDEFCRSGSLLILPRTQEMVDLFAWTRHELTTQYDGGPATPWPGPF